MHDCACHHQVVIHEQGYNSVITEREEQPKKAGSYTLGEACQTTHQGRDTEDNSMGGVVSYRTWREACQSTHQGKNSVDMERKAQQRQAGHNTLVFKKGEWITESEGSGKVVMQCGDCAYNTQLIRPKTARRRLTHHRKISHTGEGDGSHLRGDDSADTGGGENIGEDSEGV